MTDRAEHAREGRTFGVYPAEWGEPAGTQFSEERTRWVLERVRERQALAAVRAKAAGVRRAATSPAGGEHARRARQLLMRRRYPDGA